MHALPELPYARDALEPWLSQETLDYHYGRHHAAYVDRLNRLIAGTEFELLSLEALVRHSAALGETLVFDNAAQAWNHAFYWRCLTPRPASPPAGLVTALKARFGSLQVFRQRFTRAALECFGSGWTWLVLTPQDTLEVVTSANAGSPLARGDTPLLTCDVWEHAYYIDYRNARADYLQGFWELVDWTFVDAVFSRNSRARHAA